MKKHGKLSTRLVCMVAALQALAGPLPACAQQLVVSSGAAGNTYDVMVQQLAGVCQAEVGHPIVSKRSTGSMENVDRLLNNELPAAVVQADVLAYRARQDDLSGIKALLALHAEEVHVLTLTDTRKVGGVIGFGGMPLTTVADLRTAKLGAWGGSLITAQVIRLQSEIGFTVVEFNDEATALKALLDKQVDALLSVGGSPQPWVQRLDKRYRLLPFAEADTAKLKSVYRPARLSYPNLGQTGVPTVATDAVLAVRDYRTPAMAGLLVQTRRCFEQHLPELQETPGTHAKWQSVNLSTQAKWPAYVNPQPSGSQVIRKASLAKTQ